MIKILKTIVFFGTEDFSLVSLKALIGSGYNIAAVVTKPDSKRGRGQVLTMPKVKELALKHHITVWQPLKVSDINNDIKSLGNNVAGVLVSFGKIIPQSTIDLFNPGIINVHPSLLPKYRGPSPIESAIENGDRQTGVSIMQLSAKMDTGPVYGNIIYQLTGSETQPELYKSLANTGTATLLKLLPDILCGSILPTEQDDSQATYCNLLSKKNPLNLNEISATQAEQLVRAHLSFPKTKLDILGQTIIITKAHVSSEQNTALDIICQDGNYLSVDELVAPSGRTMLAKDFLNGRH
jgi:methionyl-tRNA formyltransferase